jgi:hypothetical protein
MFSFLADELPDANQKRCYDCWYLRGAVSLWCTNEDARGYRGTGMPGICKCQFWKPMGLSLGLRAQILYKKVLDRIR